MSTEESPNTYYSKLEHVLVLLLPFYNTNNCAIYLSNFISSIWSEKFKFLYNLQSNPKAKEIYDNLNRHKDKLRNPSSHGGFEKVNASLLIHSKFGAIPANILKFDNTCHYFQYPVDRKKFTEICKVFDNSDSFFNKTNKFGMEFIKVGLNVCYDKESINKYHSAMKSVKKFKEFIEYECHINDTYNNMVF